MVTTIPIFDLRSERLFDLFCIKEQQVSLLFEISRRLS